MNRARRRATLVPGFAAALGAAVAFPLPQPGFAQTDDAATLADFRACGALQRDSARLACFDGVLAADREGGGIDEVAASVPVTETVAPEPSPVVAAEPPETPVVRSEEPEPAESPVAAAPQPERPEAVAASIAQSDPPEAPPAGGPPAQSAQTSIATAERTAAASAGGEAAAIATSNSNAPRGRPAEPAPASETRAAADRTQVAVAAGSERAEASAFTIVEMTTRIPGAARFITDDGRVFVQTSGGSNYRNFPDAPFPATLEDGALGSSFLRLGPRLRVRVRAVE